MLQLIDGPCEGTYFVKRAPLYLRAVLDDKGEKDVLDLVEDTPKESEAVYVYKLEGEPGCIHIRGTKIHGFYALGTYHYLPEVEGQSLHDNEKWQAWALAQVDSKTIPSRRRTRICPESPS